MPPYRRVGDVPRKRHTLHRVDGKVAAEELMGEEGFSAASSLLYHRHSPSALHSIESIEAPEPAFTANSPLQPYHLRTGDLGPGASHDPVLGRRFLLGNDQVAMAFAAASESSPLYRNATGDELVYVHSRRARARVGVRAHGCPRRRLRGCAEQHHASVGAAEPRRALDLRGARPRRPPPQVPHRARAAARGRAVQRARPAWSRR